MIAENLREIKASIPDEVKLVAISKFHSVSSIQEAYDTGHRCFGESKMQEINLKFGQLPTDIEWHFVGHLQRNKVKHILQSTSVIHSVDSLRLLNEIIIQAASLKKRVCCLLQIHISEDDSKFGLSKEECIELLKDEIWKKSEYAYIGGLMGMATNTDDVAKIRQEFRNLKLFFEEVKESYFKEVNTFKEISMGMSQDYKIAIEEGSTMVRVGSAIFGSREY